MSLHYEFGHSKHMFDEESQVITIEDTLFHEDL